MLIKHHSLISTNMKWSMKTVALFIVCKQHQGITWHRRKLAWSNVHIIGPFYLNSLKIWVDDNIPNHTAKKFKKPLHVWASLLRWIPLNIYIQFWNCESISKALAKRNGQKSEADCCKNLSSYRRCLKSCSFVVSEYFTYKILFFILAHLYIHTYILIKLSKN